MIRVNVKNGKISVLVASGLRNIVESPVRMYREIGMGLLGRIREGFAAEQAPDGAPWEPLKPSTVRRRKGEAHPILQRSGRLKKITYAAGPESVIVGTNLAYAPAHQFGALIHRKGGSVKLHFRRAARGKGKGGYRFAKGNDKRAVYGMRANAGPYVIRIPARPFLFTRQGGLPEPWLQGIATIVKRRLESTDA